MALQAEISERENKIESKEHMWKPAPIVGRGFVQREVEVQKPQPTQYIRSNNVTLPAMMNE